MAAADHVGMLHAMFPDVGTDTISMVLESTNNDPDAAAELLLGNSMGTTSAANELVSLEAVPPPPPPAESRPALVEISPRYAMERFVQLTGLVADGHAARMYLEDAAWDVEAAVRAAVQGEAMPSPSGASPGWVETHAREGGLQLSPAAASDSHARPPPYECEHRWRNLGAIMHSAEAGPSSSGAGPSGLAHEIFSDDDDEAQSLAQARQLQEQDGEVARRLQEEEDAAYAARLMAEQPPPPPARARVDDSEDDTSQALRKLENGDERERMLAVEQLCSDPEAINVEAFAQQLDHQDASVRKAAGQVLAQIIVHEAQPDDSKQPHAAFVHQLVSCSDWYVRKLVMQMMQLAEPAVLATNSASILKVLKRARVSPDSLEESDAKHRCTAIDVATELLANIKSLPPEHVDSLLALLDCEGTWMRASEQSVRDSCLAFLMKIDPASLEAHAASLVARLQSPDPEARESFLALLRKLDPTVVAPHAESLVERLIFKRVSTKAFGDMLEVLETMLDPTVVRKFMLGVVQRDGMALKYAPRRLRKDRELVMAAMAQNAQALQSSATLKDDRDVILAAVQQDDQVAACVLKYAAPTLKDDRDVVLAAVQRSGWALQYAADALKADRKVVLAAFEQDDRALRFAAAALSTDCEFMMRVFWDHARLLFLGQAKNPDCPLSLLPIEVIREHCLPALLHSAWQSHGASFFHPLAA